MASVAGLSERGWRGSAGGLEAFADEVFDRRDAAL